MQTFSISDIENLTGIKAHTLRIWEQRFSFFLPKRKESKHRIYDNEDLKRLLRVAYLYHHGWKISKIATLTEEEMSQLVAQAPAGPDQYNSHISRLLEAMLDFHEYQFTSVLNEIIEKVGFENCIVQVCYPYLIRVGNLWATNHAIPAQEHFSSYLIQNRVLAETEKIPLIDKPAEVVLICPQGEFHELPLLFLNYLLRKNGWSTIYLGTDIRIPALEELMQTTKCPRIYLHLITNFTGYEVDDYLELMCKKFPDRQIFASGGGIQKAQRRFLNVHILRSDKMIYDFVNRSLTLSE